jgi:hypothetical protein
MFTTNSLRWGIHGSKLSECENVSMVTAYHIFWDRGFKQVFFMYNTNVGEWVIISAISWLEQATCLLTDRNKMSNPYRRPSIETSYQVLDHLDKRFQRRRFKCEKLMDDKRIQTVPIATNVVRLNPTHGKVYLKQNYVINFASDIRQVGGTPVSHTNVYWQP